MNDGPSLLRGDRYAVTRLLGEGGQAATFEAVDKKEGKLVAIKRFRVRGAKSWKEVELAEREARVLASLSHPGLPRYIEHFEENGELFLVTEKIEGESLAALQKRGATLSEQDIIRFLRETGEILDYLHGRAPPVVHRDIKPSNVLRRQDGSFALIDFGAVRDKMKPEGGSTVVGTFGFMAPEQFQGRAMPASDVYAVGATALSMLTGQPPEDLPHKGLAIDVISALGKSANPALVEVIAAMVEPDPDKRAQKITPLLGSLREAPQKPQKDSRREVKRPKKEEKRAQKYSKFEEDIGQGIEEAVEQFEQGITAAAKEWERKARKHADREERRADRAARKAERRAERHAHHMERLAMVREGRAGLPLPVAALFLFGLTIAQIAVLVSLRAIVPAFLSVLSILFGKGLRNAAGHVREAGVIAHEAIERAKQTVRGQTEQPLPVGQVEDPDEPMRVRFVDNGSAETNAAKNEDEAAEEELAAEEEAAAQKRNNVAK